MDVRLIREVRAPSGRGPGNGMFALQRALRKVRPEWLHIGGPLADGEMPWFWCWEDRTAACACAAANVPLVIGPNMLFANWAVPCGVPGERELCDAASCRLQFTESAWYRDWIRAHCGPAMRAPIVLWPYPIDPLPGGPLSPCYDLLIYEKSGFDRGLPRQLRRRWPASVQVRYGRYRRERLIELARQSRACVYLSNSDRGPLALAEILLSGCPAVGVARGAPWIVDGQTGFQVRAFDFAALCAAIEQAMRLNRQAVRAVALERFNTDMIVETILRALDTARADF
jgi:glycosyltransferase involved in cell wall biosynthesis